MPELDFKVESVTPLAYAAAPTLVFQLRVTPKGAGDGHLIRAVALRCQIRIEPGRRQYSVEEQRRLNDLFGEASRWGDTLHPLLWTHVSATLPPIEGETMFDMPVPCTFDFNIAGTKYFDALQSGDVPLLLLFSGSIFYEAPDGRLQISMVSWEKETQFRLPVNVWKQMMEHYYPNSAWLCLRKDVFDRLARFKSLKAMPTWEQAIDELLESAAQSQPA